MSFGYFLPRSLATVLRQPWTEFTSWLLGQDNLIKRAHVRESFRLLDPAPTDHMLEVGAGGLFYAGELARRVARLVAIDYAPGVGAPLASLRLPDNLSVVRGDAQALPFAEASFDKVFISEVFPVLDDPDRCAREIFRVLRPGGSIVSVHGDMFREMAEVFSWRIAKPLLRRAVARFNAPGDYASFRKRYLDLHGTRASFFENRDRFVTSTIAQGGFQDIRCTWTLGRRARLFYCFLLLVAMSRTGWPALGRGQVCFLPLIRLLDRFGRGDPDGLTMFCMARKPAMPRAGGA